MECRDVVSTFVPFAFCSTLAREYHLEGDLLEYLAELYNLSTYKFEQKYGVQEDCRERMVWRPLRVFGFSMLLVALSAADASHQLSVCPGK